MKIKFDEKYTTISLYVIVVFTVCLIITTFISEIPAIFGYIGKILSAMSPIIWGVVIAYLLSPLMNLIERHLRPLFFKQNDTHELIIENSKLTNDQKIKFKKKNKLLRTISIVICMIITIFVIIAIVAMVVPELVNSISGLFDNFPYYMNNMYITISNFLESNDTLNDTIKNWLEQQFSTIQSEFLKLFSNLKPQFESIASAIKNGISSALGGVKNLGIGFIISIYLMFSKEDFIAQLKKFMYAILPKNVCKDILTLAIKCNSVFSNFIVGKAVDSLIIGILSFITLTIMDMHYVVLISLIIGITNMIPFFGPFIGAIPSAILVLLYEPRQTIPFIIFVVILQQIDGNIIGPKILGNKMGLSTFWIMFAILVFGGLLGPIGMFIGVPLFTILYTLLSSFLHNRLKSKDLPLDKRYYGNITITEDDCLFPEKQDYSDEDIDETQVTKKSDQLISKVKEKTNISSILNNIKNIFSNKK